MLSMQNLDVIHFEKSLYIWIGEEEKTDCLLNRVVPEGWQRAARSYSE